MGAPPAIPVSYKLPARAASVPTVNGIQLQPVTSSALPACTPRCLRMLVPIVFGY